MVIGYSNLFLAVGMGKFDSVQIYNEDENEKEENEEMMKKSSIVKLNGNSRDEVEIISSTEKNEEKEKMLK